MSAVHKRLRLPKFETVFGSHDEVLEKMQGFSDMNFITLGFDASKTLDLKTITEFVNNIVGVADQYVEAKRKSQLDAFIDIFAPEVQKPEQWLREANMTISARREVIANGEWLTAAQVSEAAGFASKNTSAQPNKWKQDGLIFTIKNLGIEYFPAYALDPATGYRPVKALADIIALFSGKKDGWNLAYWFAGANGSLGGASPQRLLRSHPDAVLAAAKDDLAELDGLVHG